MSLYAGKSGKISLKKNADEKYLAHMTNWSVDMTKEIDGTPYFGGSATEEGITEKTPGAKDWTASSDGAADFSSNSSQQELMDAYQNDELVTCTFYLDADTGLMGDGYIESLTISQSADGKAEISVSIAGNGPLTLVKP